MAKIPILPGTNPKIQNLWFTCNRRIAGVSAITRRVINGCVSALILLVRSNVDAATTQPAIEDRVNACQNGIPPSIPLPPSTLPAASMKLKSPSNQQANTPISTVTREGRNTTPPSCNSSGLRWFWTPPST